MQDLNLSLKKVTKATDQQIESLKLLSDELQKVSTFSNEVTQAGQSQLLSFGITTESAYRLTRSLQDMEAAEKGITATQQDFILGANRFGKALMGQAGALSEVGILLDEKPV